MPYQERQRGVFALRGAARFTAYAIALLLAAVWLTGALASLGEPLFDLGRARIGDAIIGFAAVLNLSPQGTLKLAYMLVGAKLLLGAYLLAAVIVAAHERVRFGTSGDEMLDLGLFVSAVASIVAAGPVMGEGEALRALVGELMLAAIASGLTAFARGSPEPLISIRGEIPSSSAPPGTFVPGVTRASLSFVKWMDCRVEPGNGEKMRVSIGRLARVGVRALGRMLTLIRCLRARLRSPQPA